MRGRFITFEGGEGVGKSTQIAHVAHFLKSCNVPLVITREPGGTEGAEKIRKLLVEGSVDQWDAKAELLLMATARRDHVLKVIRPSLEQGIWVLCDRFHDSTIAYQGYGHKVSLDFIAILAEHLLEGCTPDRTYIFMMDTFTGLDRAKARKDHEDRFERMGLDFHRRVQEGYYLIAKSEPDRCQIIDALQPINVISDILIQDLKKHFNFNENHFSESTGGGAMSG